MARISEKAVRPRQYVFNRLSKSRLATLAPGVTNLREQERRQVLSARAARRAAERHLAARHADNILAGITELIPESDQIGELERELEELRTRKQQLFEQLRQSLDEENQLARTNDHVTSGKRKRSSTTTSTAVANARQWPERAQRGNTQVSSSCTEHQQEDDQRNSPNL